MRFLESECVCGFNLATAEPKEVLYIGKGKDKVPYGECPACGRDYLLTEEEAATTPVAETPEPAEPAEPAEPGESTGEGGEGSEEASPAEVPGED